MNIVHEHKLHFFLNVNVKKTNRNLAKWSLLVVTLQWEELKGGFEQLEYLRGIIKDHFNVEMEGGH